MQKGKKMYLSNNIIICTGDIDTDDIIKNLQTYQFIFKPIDEYINKIEEEIENED